MKRRALAISVQGEFATGCEANPINMTALDTKVTTCPNRKRWAHLRWHQVIRRHHRA